MKTKCAYCNRDATTYHRPPPINRKAMPGIPLCGTDCGRVKIDRKGKVK